MQQEDRVCGMRTSLKYHNATSTVRGQKVCSTKKSHLQYEEVVQHKKRVYCQLNEEKVCIIKNVTSVVRGDKVCSIRRVAPGV